MNRMLPSLLKTDDKVKKYIHNSAWMLLEQFLKMFSGIFVGIYMARYLGPEKFGVLSYIMALSAFFITIARMGMDSVLVRELTKQPERKEQLLGTAFWMMMPIALLCYTILLVITAITNESLEIKIFTLIIGTSILFTPSLLFDYLYQSEIRAKRSTYAKVFTLFITSILKLLLIFQGSDFFWFVIVTVLDQAILAIFLFVSFIATHKFNFINKFSISYAKELSSSVWPVILASLAVLIYMRIDQIMIREMLGLEEVGLYSAASKLLGAWIVVPYTVSISLLPAIVKLKHNNHINYEKCLAQLFGATIWLCIMVSLFITFFGEYLIALTFGDSYRESALVAILLMWSSVFVSMGSISARYFTVEKMERKIAFRTVFSACINVVLNFFLIPIYGIKGAAIATLITNFISSYFLDWFDKDLKVLLAIKHRSIFLIF